MIGAGEVYAGDTLADKAGQQFPVNIELRIKEKCRFVSRGGLKLEKGLQALSVNPSGMCCLDVGASSGGFTDCLLQYGATKVFAVDVAYGQLNWKLRQDNRVVVIERFNARRLTSEVLGEPVDLAVMDASFISITKIIPSLIPLFRDRVRILTLIKPQFELPKEKVGPGGVVREHALHMEAVNKIKAFSQSSDLQCSEPVTSPILGPKGNTEFLVLLTS